MEISYEKHGVEGIENCLTYLAACEPDYIDSDEFEIIGEDEEGREGSADISIINLAEEACKALAAQRKRIAELEEREAALAASLEEHATLIRDLQQHHLADKKGRRESDRMIKRLFGISHVSATASLARRDALNKAEGMDWVLAQSCNEENEGVMWRNKIVEPEIQRLRQQADQC
ncbi:hypothetical protein AAG587_08140 [Vreelandella neptunia]|uniref:hypothetical protein n=1 Tax=Vreelandella neptunia TaxID=115551 RepID=UPI003159C254